MSPLRNMLAICYTQSYPTSTTFSIFSSRILKEQFLKDVKSSNATKGLFQCQGSSKVLKVLPVSTASVKFHDLILPLTPLPPISHNCFSFTSNHPQYIRPGLSLTLCQIVLCSHTRLSSVPYLFAPDLPPFCAPRCSDMPASDHGNPSFACPVSTLFVPAV